MDGNSFEGPAGELGCHSQYGSLGGKGKNAFRVSARRTRCARNASPLFPLTLGLGSPPPGSPLPPPPHCFQITGGREEPYSGPHSYAGHKFDRRGRGTGTDGQTEAEGRERGSEQGKTRPPRSTQRLCSSPGRTRSMQSPRVPDESEANVAQGGVGTSPRGYPSTRWVRVTGLDALHGTFYLSRKMPLEVGVLTLTSQERKASLCERYRNPFQRHPPPGAV